MYHTTQDDKYVILSNMENVNKSKDVKPIDFSELKTIIERQKYNDIVRSQYSKYLQSSLSIWTSTEKQDQHILTTLYNLRNVDDMTSSKSPFDTTVEISIPSPISIEDATSHKVITKIQQDAVHRIAVGLQLNKLKHIIPNFQMTYGNYKLQIPLIDKNNKKTINVNDVSIPSAYYGLLERYDTASRSLKSFIKEHQYDKEPIINVFLQIVCSLRIAKDVYNFNHGNINDQDIIIVNNTIQNSHIAYPSFKTGYKVKVKSDHIAYITNFTHSTIKLDDVGISKPRDHSSNDISSLKSILTDSKILSSSSYDTIKTHNDLISFLSKTLKNKTITPSSSSINNCDDRECLTLPHQEQSPQRYSSDQWKTEDRLLQDICRGSISYHNLQNIYTNLEIHINKYDNIHDKHNIDSTTKQLYDDAKICKDIIGKKVLNSLR
jgi:hypothetical protein